MAPKMFNTVLFFACFLGIRFAGADFRAICDNIVTARLDPILVPGAMSKHLHDVGGSLAFGPIETPGAMAAALSSCSIIGDFSSYWAPAVYFNDTATGNLTHLPAAMIPYYLTGRSQPLANAVSMAYNFPANLSMITTVVQKTCRYKGVYTSFTNLPKDNSGCDKLTLNYAFPNCWDGGVYKANQSHVSSTLKGQTSLGPCDAAHPHALFSVRLEHTVFIPPQYETWTGKCPYTLSSGAGFSTAHADATLVWDNAVLVRLANLCPTLSGSECDSNFTSQPGFADAYRAGNVTAAIAAPFAATIPDVYKTEPLPGAHPPF